MNSPKDVDEPCDDTWYFDAQRALSSKLSFVCDLREAQKRTYNLFMDYGANARDQSNLPEFLPRP